jgi:Protein of unknown function (DUF1318)
VIRLELQEILKAPAQGSEAVKPYMDKGSVGINQNALLVVRSSEGLSRKHRAEMQQLIEGENRDREAPYTEIGGQQFLPMRCRRLRESLPRAGSIRPNRAGGSRTRKEIGKGSKHYPRCWS